jgi:Zn-dependent M28 family amino/carboxypeptidase
MLHFKLLTHLACRLIRGASPFNVILSIGCIACSSPGARAQTVGPDSWDRAISVANKISQDSLHGHIRFLADDLLEGRGPGSNGDRLAQLYLESQFRSFGLVPVESMKSYRQAFPMIGLTAAPDKQWTFGPSKSSSKPLTFDFFKDYIAVAGKPEKTLRVQDAEIVFVGYGIQAPEYEWDDFKGMNLHGKILLMMNNDPESDPKIFEGSKRLYYGRWDYKYESAARQGAAGAIIIHTTPSAGYPFTVVQTSWTGEAFELRETGSERMAMKGWLTEEASSKLVAHAGFQLKDLLQQAESREFKPVPLGVSLTTSIQCEVREKETANVLAVLPGSDPKLKDEYVVFMAHHDHIGIAAERDERGDNIYNGAIDNASGTAAILAIASAIKESGSRPRRSLLFAAVGAEEQGLLGSKYFAEHPPVPNGRQSAVVNIDCINFLGLTKDVNVIGLGKSSLDRLVEQVAKHQKRVVVPDRDPSKGFFYRSDQFSLAKVGVPGVYLHAGQAFFDKPEGWGKERMEVWTNKNYHQRSDEYDPNWDLSGAVQDARLLFMVGWLAADADTMQSWTPGDEFEAARKAALQSLSQ